MVLAIAHILSFLGKCKSTLYAFRLLWAGNDLAQPVGAPFAAVAVAHNQRGKLQFSGTGGHLEQFGNVGGGG